MNFTDSGEVVLTGQNPYMILFDGDGPPSTMLSFWRVHHSLVGPGHALYVRSDVTAGASRVFTDNIALARFIQTELYANNAMPFGLFADIAIDAVDATFQQRGDARSFITETVISADDECSLSWYDFLPAFKGGTAADPATKQGHTHYALYIPATRVRLALNGTVASGTPTPNTRDGRAMSSAGLAWSETWVRPSST